MLTMDLELGTSYIISVQPLMSSELFVVDVFLACL